MELCFFLSVKYVTVCKVLGKVMAGDEVGGIFCTPAEKLGLELINSITSE